MTALPPLPETDDPLILLGVPLTDASKLTLRRAYVRLIKIYRPERAPAEFQRIRAAYDAATEQLAWRSWVGFDEDEGAAAAAAAAEAAAAAAAAAPEAAETPNVEEAAETADAVETPDAPATAGDPDLRADAATATSPETALDAARAHWRAGDAHAAFDAAQRACAAHPTAADAWWIASRALHATGATAAEAHGWLVRGLQAGAPLATRLATELPPRELDQLVAHPEVSWPLLTRQSARNAALALQRARMEELLCNDQLPQAIAEVGDPAYVRASIAEPELEPIALRVVAAASWHHTAAAATLYQQFQSSAADDWEVQLLHDRVAHARFLGVNAPPAAALPAALLRLLTVLPVVDERRRARCVRSASRAASAAPAQWVCALDLLGDHDQDLLVWLHDLLDRDDDADDAGDDEGNIAGGEEERHADDIGRDDIGRDDIGGDAIGRDDIGGDDIDSDPLDQIAAALGTRRSTTAVERLTPLMRAIDTAISKSPVNRTQNIGLGLILASFIPAIRFLHWWTIGYAVVAFVGVITLISILDRQLYARVIRPRLAADVSEHGTRVKAFVTWLEVHSKWSDNVGRFDTEIKEDGALRLLGRLRRMVRRQARL